jgi:hypothetical protein
MRAILMVLDSLMKMSSSLCFILDHLFFLSGVMAVFFPASLSRARYLIHTRYLIHNWRFQVSNVLNETIQVHHCDSIIGMKSALFAGISTAGDSSKSSGGPAGI